MIDLQKLRALAMAATAGPWDMQTGVYADPDGDDDLSFARGPMIKRDSGDTWNGRWRQQARANANFIAAANPTTILALLDRIDELEANAVRMREYRFALEGIKTDGKGNPL